MKIDIADQSEEQKKKILAKQESLLNNAELLLEKRNNLIDQFTKNNVISMGDKFYDAPKKSEESILEKLEEKSDQSIPKWVQVSEDRFNLMKLKINKNKKLSTTIDKKSYTLNDVNELVNKTAENKIDKNNAIKEYNNLVNKAEEIAGLRPTKHRQKNVRDI